MRSFSAPWSIKPRQPFHYSQRENPGDLDVDNGNVYANCGIPNYAFYIATMAARGPPFETVGRIWFDAMINEHLGESCTFARFAAFTIAYAKRDDPELVDAIVGG